MTEWFWALVLKSGGPELGFPIISTSIKVADHSLRAFADAIQRAKGLQNKHAVNRTVLFLLKHPHYLRYFSLLLNPVY